MQFLPVPLSLAGNTSLTNPQLSPTTSYKDGPLLHQLEKTLLVRMFRKGRKQRRINENDVEEEKADDDEEEVAGL
uniref:Uncharacterized protein n=1 Tax=Solanum tuberosum TaxID=4113 RepID=M1CP21_SOLTU